MSNSNNLSQRYKAYKSGKRNPLPFEEWKRRYGLRAPRGTANTTSDVQDTIRQTVPVSTGDDATDAVVARVLAALGVKSNHPVADALVQHESATVQPDEEAHVKRTSKRNARNGNGNARNAGVRPENRGELATAKQLWVLNKHGLLADLIDDSDDGTISRGAASDALEMVLA